MRIKLILVLALLALVVGCHSDLNEAKGEFLCEEEQGLYSWGYNNAGNVFKITCNSGKIVKLTSTEFDEVSSPNVAKYLKQAKNNIDK